MKNKETFDHISHAIACRPGKNFSDGLSPSVGIPDHERAIAQHQKYCEALEKCGVSVTMLPSDPSFPDGCFVSSAAVVTDYLAVLGNFSDNSPRQGEQKNVASALAGTKFLKFITSPGLLDGSDVLQLRDHFYIGTSDRTNHEGAAQLAFFLNEYGCKVTVLDRLEGRSLHLGTAASYLGRDRILVREEVARHFAFLEYEKIIVPHQEQGAANALMVNGTLIMPAGYAGTTEKVKQLGIPVIEVNISEFEKMNGCLGRLSLLLPKAVSSGVVEWTVKPRKTAA